MTTVTEIKSAIEHLPEKDYKVFLSWFEEYEEEHWDKQLEKDIASGKLDDLANEALREFKERKCTKL